MVDWASQEQVTKDEGLSSPFIPFVTERAANAPRPGVYVNLVFAFFGLYVWEVFQTSDFEWAVLQRRRKLRWHWVSRTNVKSHPVMTS